MTPPVAVDGARVGVLGLGRSGRAAARLLTERGAIVYASDVASGEAVESSAAALRGAGIEAGVGGHDPDRLARCDWIVASPGIPPTAPVFALPGVRDKPVLGEIEVASWFARAPIVAVTGTNGKTTTTALLGAVAEAAGIRVAVAGNIGRAFADVICEVGDVEWYVLEVSSFQLHRIRTFRPRIGVILNLAPDHLDVYDDVAAYVADKARIAENMGVGDHLCLNAEDPVVAEIGSGPDVVRHAFHRSADVERGVTVADGWITIRNEPSVADRSEPLEARRRVLEVDEIAIPGAHNVQNALAAALTGTLMGADADAVARALVGFGGVPHRLETVAEAGGVRWVNDSKATNVEAATVGLAAFDGPLVVILGGRHKGSPYAPLVPLLAERSRRVLAIGEAAPLLARELGDVVEVESAGTLERAVERARRIARPGDVVLLSPACSSYDQFEDYEERGEAFRRLVAAGAARSDTPAGAGRSK